MMDRSSRFISLSGLSGIAAGLCGLAGAWAIQRWFSALPLEVQNSFFNAGNSNQPGASLSGAATSQLLQISLVTFIAAVIVAFLFTWLRSKKNNTPLWGGATRRLLWATLIPIVAGAIFLYKTMQGGAYFLLAPGCLVFYGLSLLQGGRYTVSEVKYLGITMMGCGIICLFFPEKGVALWAFGFGVLHIVYGALMWWRYERNTLQTPN